MKYLAAIWTTLDRIFGIEEQLGSKRFKAAVLTAALVFLGIDSSYTIEQILALAGGPGIATMGYVLADIRWKSDKYDSAGLLHSEMLFELRAPYRTADAAFGRLKTIESSTHIPPRTTRFATIHFAASLFPLVALLHTH